MNLQVSQIREDESKYQAVFGRKCLIYLLCIFKFQSVNCDAKYIPLVFKTGLASLTVKAVGLVYHNNPSNLLSIGPCL